MTYKQTTKDKLLIATILAATVYLVLAVATFALRHPWMTKTEQLIYIGRMLTFGTVDYDEARPRR